MKLKTKGKTEDYIKLQSKPAQEILIALTELIRKAAPKAEERIMWGLPWWVLDGNLCYLTAVKDRVNFGFSRGAELDDLDEFLEGTGKGMRHIKINSVSEIRKTKFTALIKQAVKLNEQDKQV